MPQRLKAVEKVPTEEVQGEGSYVLVRKVTFKERDIALAHAKEILRNAKQSQAELQAEETDSESVKAQKALSVQEYAIDIQEKAERIKLDALKDHIIEWNWVDVDGSPLPQVHEDPSVLEQLVMEEITALTNAMGTGDAADQNAKN